MEHAQVFFLIGVNTLVLVMDYDGAPEDYRQVRARQLRTHTPKSHRNCPAQMTAAVRGCCGPRRGPSLEATGQPRFASGQGLCLLAAQPEPANHPVAFKTRRSVL